MPKMNGACADCGTTMQQTGNYKSGISRCRPCRRAGRQHGSEVMYSKGKCRCQICSAGNTTRFRDYKERRAAAGRPLDWDSYKARFPKVCPLCGKDFMGRKEVTYCSRACNPNNQLRNTRVTRLRRMTSEGRAFLLRAEKLLEKAARGTSGGRLIWVQGPCMQCRKPFLSKGVSSRYCSDECRMAAIGRANLTKGWISKRRRFVIYERDGWACQICGVVLSADGVGPLMPTLDHIVPRAKSGLHTSDNLRMACHRCNALRGDLTYMTDEDVRRAVAA